MDTQTDTAAPAPDPGSLAAHILAESPVEAAPAAPGPVAGAEVTPEAEADSHEPDASVSEAARVLRKSRSEERKAKIHAEIADAVRERESTRAEVARLRAERERLAQAPAHQSAAADPSDPKPILDQFEDFNAFMDARDAWAIREAERRMDARQQHSQRQQVETQQAQTLAARGQDARTAYTDYDAVIEPAIAAFNGNPRADDVAEYVANSPAGGALFYRLGKDPAALQAVLTANSPFALARELARLEAQITQPTQAAPIHTKAPTPPTRTVGGGAQTAVLDTRKGVPLADHIRIEEAEIADRRRRGLRY